MEGGIPGVTEDAEDAEGRTSRVLGEGGGRGFSRPKISSKAFLLRAMTTKKSI